MNAHPTENVAFVDSEQPIRRYSSAAYPVGSKAPNPWGLYDMHGNLYEWVDDWYGDAYYASSPSTDPTGPTTGVQRVARGGSWIALAQYARSAFRHSNGPDYSDFYFGFRVAADAFTTGTTHPADTNGDWVMGISEVTAYGSAWKSGATWPNPPNPIPINYVTNAGALWKQGENYHHDPGEDPPWTAGAGLVRPR